VAIQRFLDSGGNVIPNIPGIARTPTGIYVWWNILL
jgi:hypothetical protein